MRLTESVTSDSFSSRTLALSQLTFHKLQLLYNVGYYLKTFQALHLQSLAST